MIRHFLAIFAFILVAVPCYSHTLIDNFDRSNRPLSSDGWGNVEGGCSIVNGSMGGTTAAHENLCYTPSVYNSDMAAFITITTKPEAVDSGLSFFVRFNSTTFSGYDIQMTTQSGLDRFRLFRFDNGTFGNQLGSTYYAEVAAGDKFGIVAQGTSLKCYYLPVGSKQWAKIIDVVDSTYQSGGHIAFGAYSNVGRYDDLIGGNNLNLPTTVIFEDSFNGFTSGWTPSFSGDGAALYPWTADESFNPENPADNGGGALITNYEPSTYPANQRTNSNSWNGWVQHATSTGSISIQPSGGVGDSPACRFRLVKYPGLSNELGIHKWLGNVDYDEVYVQYKIKFGASGDDFWWNGSWADGGPNDPNDLGIIWKLGRVWTGFNPTDYDKTGGQSQPVENTAWTDESNWRCGIWIWGVMADIWNEAPNSLFFYLADFYWSPTCPDGGAGSCDSQNAARLGPYFWDWKRYTTNAVPLTSYGRLNSFLNSGDPLDNNGAFTEAQNFHTIEMRFKNRSAPTTADGAFQMWVDYVEITDDTNINPVVTPSMSTDPDDYGINFVRFGDNFNNLTRNIPDNPGYMDVFIENIIISSTPIDGYSIADADGAITHISVLNSGANRVISNNGTVITVGN